MTYEDRWKTYVAWIEKKVGPVEPNPTEIAHLKAGDERLAEFGQRGLRRATERSSEENELRRRIYDCAVTTTTFLSNDKKAELSGTTPSTPTHKSPRDPSAR